MTLMWISEHFMLFLAKTVFLNWHWRSMSFEGTESTIKTVGNLILCHKYNSLAKTGYIFIMILCGQISHKM